MVDDVRRYLHAGSIRFKFPGWVRRLGMIADGRSCADVLHQLSAVAGSVAALRRGVAERHVRHCLIEQLERGETEGAVAGIVDLLVGGPRLSQDAESSCAPMPAGD